MIISGLKYLMYRHPWISSFFGISTFISILATIILVSWARFVQNEESTTVNVSESQDDQQPNPVTDVSAPVVVPNTESSSSPDSREESPSVAAPLDLGEVPTKTKPSQALLVSF